jgi:hypothetical protein
MARRTTTNLAKPLRPGRDRILGPRTAFIAAILCSAAAWSVAAGTIPDQVVLPTVATLLFVLAAVTAAAAWKSRNSAGNDVTYWDVAGALTLIGICVSALIEPEHLTRIMEGPVGRK